MKPWQEPLKQSTHQRGKGRTNREDPKVRARRPKIQKLVTNGAKELILLVRTSADAAPAMALFFLYGLDTAVQQPAEN